MYGELDASDIELLNAISNLAPVYRKEYRDYIYYLLTKQYKRELMGAIFQNQLLHGLLQSTRHLVERDDFPASQVEKRIGQMQELYFGIFEQIHLKYSELVDGLDSHELVRDFGKLSFENLNRACRSGNCLLIRMEMMEFYQGYHRHAQKKEARKIFAV
ncbi:MAG: hypothetical protein PHG75_04980 [Syntrophomonas sp.]|nr:hypothetical protein [Syntrophomonas sp.]